MSSGTDRMGVLRLEKDGSNAELQYQIGQVELTLGLLLALAVEGDRDGAGLALTLVQMRLREVGAYAAEIAAAVAEPAAEGA